MSSLLSESLQTKLFHCPNCNKLVSELKDSCQYCNLSISSEEKERILTLERAELKKQNLNSQRNSIIISLIFFILGAGLIAFNIFEFNYSNQININCLAPLFLIGGGGIAIKSILKYREIKTDF